MKNMIQTQLGVGDRTAIDELLTQLEAALAGKLASLSDDERRQYGSINEQNKLLVNKARDFHQSSPAMSSPDVDWTEFESDYQSRVFLETRATRLAELVYQMQSTKILHDYDNYQDALNDYAYSQYKNGAGENGYAEKVAELRQFFNRTSSVSKPANENDNP